MVGQMGVFRICVSKIRQFICIKRILLVRRPPYPTFLTPACRPSPVWPGFSQNISISFSYFQYLGIESTYSYLLTHAIFYQTITSNALQLGLYSQGVSPCSKISYNQVRNCLVFSDSLGSVDSNSFYKNKSLLPHVCRYFLAPFTDVWGLSPFYMTTSTLFLFPLAFLRGA